MPSCIGSPAEWQARSLRRNGTPRKGPWGCAGSAACTRALSKSGWITALSSGLSFSMRVMAASVSSDGVTSPSRTNSAWAVASSRARSSLMPDTLWRRRSVVP